VRPGRKDLDEQMKKVMNLRPLELKTLEDAKMPSGLKSADATATKKSKKDQRAYDPKMEPEIGGQIGNE